jgi:serine/threonine protein phosphatase PrpC
VTVLRSGSASDVGRVRSVNEDLALESPTLFAVADGMGGHAGGEVASRTAIEALQREFARHPSAEGLAGAVRQANLAVYERSQEDAELRGMGTTLTAAALVATDEGDRLVMANVGDSRSYRFHHGELIQLSHDHSVAEELVDRGELSEAEAAIHPHRHILTRALGVSDEVDIDLWQMTPEAGDRYVLCSDGLTNELPEGRIAKVLSSVPDPQEAAETLVRLANEHGGSDNITVVVLDVVVGETPSGDGDRSRAASATGPGAAASAAGAGAAASAAGAASAGADPAPARAPGPARRGGGRGEGGGPGSKPLGSPAPTPAAGALVTSERPAPAPSLLGRSAPSSTDPASGMRAMTARAAEVNQRLRTRRFTLRVLLFAVVLAAIVVGAFAAVRLYVDSSYFVRLHQGQVVIYEGRIGGFLGMQPKIVQRTGLAASQVPPSYLSSSQNVVNGVEEPSLQAAREYVCGLEAVEHAENPAQALPPCPAGATRRSPAGTAR